MMSNWGSSVDEPNKKTQEFYNLRHFIHSKKRSGLQRSVTFKRFWTLKGLEEGVLEICPYLWKNPG